MAMMAVLGVPPARLRGVGISLSRLLSREEHAKQAATSISSFFKKAQHVESKSDVVPQPLQTAHEVVDADADDADDADDVCIVSSAASPPSQRRCPDYRNGSASPPIQSTPSRWDPEVLSELPPDIIEVFFYINLN